MSWKEGRRVVDLEVLAKGLRCKQCGGLLDLERTQRETRLGLASLLHIVCSCGLTNVVHTGSQQQRPDGKVTFTVNTVASANLLQCGVLAYVVQNFFTALCVPLPVPPFDDICLDTSSSSGFADQLLDFSLGSADLGVGESCEESAITADTCIGEMSVSAKNDSVTASQCHNAAWPKLEEPDKQDISSAEGAAVKSDGEDSGDNSYPVTVTFQANDTPAADKKSGESIAEVPKTEVTVPEAEASNKTTADRVQVQNTAVIVSTSSAEKPFGCGVCFKAYRTKEACQAHIQQHIGDKPFLCDECGKGFVCNYNLKLHMKQHTGERPHRCFVCGKGFIREFTLKRHMLKHKGHTPFTCDQCGEGFSSHESLKRHWRLHTGEKPFKCDQCEKRFRGESNLYAHRRRHFGIKPYKCQDCGAAFVESTHLTRHRRTHTGEQPYICEICGVRYTQSGTLAAHRKKHTGEPKTVKILQCADCGKIFHSYTQLKRHKRVHTGEKPYACDYCEMAFTQSSSLKAHRRIHTGERPFSCDQCGEAFLYPRTLKRHKKKHLEDG